MYELRARSMCQPTEVYIFLSCRGVQRMLLLLQRFPSVLHQQADGCRSCVELGHFVLLNDLPEPADMRVNRNTFELEKTHTLLKGALEGAPRATFQTYEDTCGAVCKRAVCDVGVAGDPADVGGAPVHVVMVMVENVLEGQRRIE